MRLLLAALLFIVFYFLLFPYPLGLEMVARPRWATPLALEEGSPLPAVSKGEPPQETSPFRLGDRFGYVGPDGRLWYEGKVLYRVALSSSGFVNFTRLGSDWILQDRSGRGMSSYHGAGYPLLDPSGARFFNVKSDLSGIRELDRGGGTLWDRDVPTLITTMSVQGDLVLLGLLNGSLLILDRHGQPAFDYAPGGSRIPVIFGSALAPDDSLAAVVSGIDPQVLVILGRRGAAWEARRRIPLPTSSRRELRLAFSPDSRWLFLEGPQGPGIVDPSTAALRWLDLPGKLVGAAFLSPGGVKPESPYPLAAFASLEAGLARLVIQPTAGPPVCRAEFPARELSLASVDGQILLGWDGQLMRIDVEGM